MKHSRGQRVADNQAFVERGERLKTGERLRGKVAVITDAAGSVGQRLCLRFLREGAQIAMLDRDARGLESFHSALSTSHGVDITAALPIVCDATDPAQPRAAVEQIEAHFFKRIDILLNVVVPLVPRQRLEDLSIDETARDAFHTIFGMAWNMVRAVAPHLDAGASIVNVSPLLSPANSASYAACVVPTAAFDTWSRHLASELADVGIRVNTVLPGPFASETTADDVADPVRSSPKAADVANAVVFLSSDESAAINGHRFEITHRIVEPHESRSLLVSRPGLRIVDATGRTVLIIAGEQTADALEIARIHAERGASVLLGVGSDDALFAARAQLERENDSRIVAVRFDRRNSREMSAVLRSSARDLCGVVILPASKAERFRGRLSEATDDDVMTFLDDELLGSMRVVRELAHHWNTAEPTSRPPRVVFLSNGDDGRGNVYADILAAAQEQLSRVWRDETTREAMAGDRDRSQWIVQIVRFTNAEAESLRFAGAWSAKLIHGKRRMKPVSLYLPESLEGDTGARQATFGDRESLIGLHLGKVALITGGSAGIGGQIGRLLAFAGARVVLAARDREKLETTRAAIVQELEAIGYDDAADRVAILHGIEVSDEASLQRSVDVTLETFGRLDYLINNAGISGAEQMVVDMPLEAWRRTLRANLISNFSLMARVVPEMKRRGSGYVVNVSSYFGGEKYVAVAYPNRADYAVSKAGQRALVETMAAFVGPAVQFNAVAPGPVDGVRLRGADGPGLFERRGRLIVENQRLNALYAVAIRSLRAGDDVTRFVESAAVNEIEQLLADPATPPPLRAFCEHIVAERPADPDCSSHAWLMNRSIAKKFLERLERGGYISVGCGALRSEPPEPFLSQRDVRRNAEKVSAGVLKLLHLKKMPTETEVALATVYFLADRAISGETFHPSGGLKQERSVTERELFGRSKEERIELMRGGTAWIIGEHPIAQIVRAVKTYFEDCLVGHIVLLTRSADAAAQVRDLLTPDQVARISFLTIAMDIESGLQAALTQFERPTAILSLPMGVLPTTIFDGPEAMTGPQFETMLEEQVTNHFRVARVASLLEDVRLILVSPEVAHGGNTSEFAMASFIKTTLHALTATVAVENERLVHEVPVNQINATRQVQSDEPRNPTEYEEKMDRYARAIVLESGPLPAAEESRYRSRVYRGVAITV